MVEKVERLLKVVAVVGRLMIRYQGCRGQLREFLGRSLSKRTVDLQDAPNHIASSTMTQ